MTHLRAQNTGVSPSFDIIVTRRGVPDVSIPVSFPAELQRGSSSSPLGGGRLRGGAEPTSLGFSRARGFRGRGTRDPGGRVGGWGVGGWEGRGGWGGGTSGAPRGTSRKSRAVHEPRRNPRAPPTSAVATDRELSALFGTCRSPPRQHWDQADLSKESQKVDFFTRGAGEWGGGGVGVGGGGDNRILFEGGGGGGGATGQLA